MKTFGRQKITDHYMEMIRRFALKPIRTDAECERATEILDQYITAENPDRGVADYIEVLVGLVEEYERKHHPVELPGLTPLHRLKFLMRENGLTRADLGRLLGSSGLASMILDGKRSISKLNAKILGKRFAVNPGAFI